MPTKIRLEEKKEIEQIRYELVGLKKNPFHPDPDPPDLPTVFAEYRKVWDKISSKISLVRTKGYNQNLILFANYGRGKSHIIKFLRSQLNSSEMQGIAFISNLPQSLSFSDLYKRLITSVEKNVLMERIKPDKIENLHGQIGKDMESALKCLFDPNKSGLAWQWLQGVSTYADERLGISVKSKIERGDELCLTALLALFDALIKSNIKIIFVGIDELETAKTRTTGESRDTERLLELIRRFIDEVQSNVFLLLAATEEWQKVWNRFGPLVSRFPSYDIETLEPISDIEEYKLFILEYLESERVDDVKVWKETCEMNKDQKSQITKEQLLKSGVSDIEIDELYSKRESLEEYLLFPFTDDGIVQLFKITGGLPRNVVKSCHFLIEKSVEQASDVNPVNVINAKFVLTSGPEIKPLLL